MIIVTGANGFIGSAFVKELNQRGLNQILCVDPISIENRKELLANKIMKGFLSESALFPFLADIKNQQQVDWVIHLGAISSTTETNWQKLYENNFLYSKKVFEWCTENQVPLIYASSGATYGLGDLGYSDQTDCSLLTPLNLYGKSKLMFDQWVLEQNKFPPNWYGLRFFNVYGPNEYFKESMTSVVFKAFQQIKSCGEMKLFKSYHPGYKDGEQKRDFIYVKDVTRWMCELMERKPKSDIYNMGTGLARTWNDLVSGVFASLNLKPNINYIEMPENLRNQYQYFTQADMEKWKTLGLSDSKWSVEAGVKDYVENYLSKPNPYL